MGIRKTFLAALLISLVSIAGTVQAEARTISGVIQDSKGKPVAGVWVTASDDACNGTQYDSSSESDAKGNFSLTLENITSENVYLNTNGTTDGYYLVTYQSEAGGDVLCQKASAIKVPATGLANINVLALTGGRISGQVLNRDNKGVSNASVIVRSGCGDEDMVVAYTTADENGAYSVPVQAGEVVVQVDASEVGLYYQNQYWESGSTCSEASKITVKQQETNSNIDFKLLSAGAVTGQVLDVNGSPVVNAYVKFSTDSCSLKTVGFTQTDSNGQFIQGGLPTAQDLFINVNPFETDYYHVAKAWTNLGGVGDCKLAEAFTLEENTIKKDVNLVLDMAGAISGKVLDVNGQPLVGVVVEAYNAPCKNGDWVADTLTQSDGSFLLTGLYGNVYLDAMILSKESVESKYMVDEYWDGVKGTVSCEDAVQLSLELGKVINGFDFVIEYSGTLNGQVTDKVGTPVGGVVVSAYETKCGGKALAATYTEADGSFSLTGVVADKVYLVADDSEYNPWWVSGWYVNAGELKVACQDAEYVTVKHNAKIDGLLIRVDEVNSFVTGILTSVNGSLKKVIKLVKNNKKGKKLNNYKKKISSELQVIDDSSVVIPELDDVEKNINTGIKRANLKKLKEAKKEILKIQEQYK